MLIRRMRQKHGSGRAAGRSASYSMREHRNDADRARSFDYTPARSASSQGTARALVSPPAAPPTLSRFERVPGDDEIAAAVAAAAAVVLGLLLGLGLEQALRVGHAEERAASPPRVDSEHWFAARARMMDFDRVPQ